MTSHKVFRGLMILTVLLVLTAGSAAHPVKAQENIEVILHSVVSVPSPGEMAYRVRAYASVIDSNKRALTDLTLENFTLSEDSQEVALQTVSTADSEPIHVVMVLDTSGSMSGAGIQGVREAAKNFLSQLNESDQAALLTFNDKISRVSDFTSNHSMTANMVDEVNPVPNAGTCLFDAAYQAIEMASTLPQGRRAVILLTDGVDETFKGEKCSTLKDDDVIALAAKGGTRTPVYTVGLGNQIDSKNLDRISIMTGGQYLTSATATDLVNLFTNLAGLLKSQYALDYTSTSAPGAHTLTLEVNNAGFSGITSINFVLPSLPLQIVLSTPANGQSVSGTTNIIASLSGGGARIAYVRFDVDGMEIGRAENLPFQITWEPKRDGARVIRAVAVGSDGSELTAAEITVVVALPVLATDVPTAAPTIVASQLPRTKRMLGIGTIASLTLALVTISASGYFLFFHKKKSFTPMDLGKVTSASSIQILDNPTLEVTNSDDESEIGRNLEMGEPSITIGRGTDNTFVFPMDKAASRSHVLIERKGTIYYLSEIDIPKRPTFGTFVNHTQIDEGVQVLLKDGDTIQLGKRLTLRFHKPVPPADEDVTMDGINLQGDDETLEDFALDMPANLDPDGTLEFYDQSN